MHLPLVTGRRKKDLLTTHLHSAEAPRHTRTVDVQDSVAFRSARSCARVIYTYNTLASGIWGSEALHNTKFHASPTAHRTHGWPQS